jgi:hypothetical protein
MRHRRAVSPDWLRHHFESLKLLSSFCAAKQACRSKQFVISDITGRQQAKASKQSAPHFMMSQSIFNSTARESV